MLTNDFDKKAAVGRLHGGSPSTAVRGRQHGPIQTVRAAPPAPEAGGPVQVRLCPGPGPTWRQTRDFSSRYCSILAPSMAPRLSKWISMYFPKRLELSLRMVLAFPNASGWGEGHGPGQHPPSPQPPLRALALPSRMGVASSTCCSIHECCPLTAARNCRISLVLSVFPAPDSPLHTTRRKRQGPSRTAWASPYGASVQAASPTCTSPSPICQTG